MEPTEFVFSTPELLQQFLLQATYDDTLRLCRLNASAFALCSQPLFWALKAELHYGTPIQEFRNTNLNPQERYLEIRTLNGEVFPGAEKFISYDEFARRAVKQGKKPELDYIVSKGYQNWDLIAFEAAKNKNLAMLAGMLSDSQDPNTTTLIRQALLGALEGGHQDLYDLINALTNYRANPALFELANAAVKGGHREIFDSLRSSAPEYHWDWDILAMLALESGNLELFYYVLSLAPPNHQWDWDTVIQGPIRSGDQQLFDTVRSLNPGWNWNWDNLALYALESGNVELFDHIRSLVPPNFTWDWNELLGSAVISENKEAVKHIFSLGSEGEWNWNWNDFANTTISNGDISMFEYIRKLAPSNWNWDWNRFKTNASGNNRGEFVNYLQQIAPQ